MNQYILSNLFLEIYNSLYPKKIKKLKIKNYEELEDTLKKYLFSILGYKIRNNYSMHYDEIKIYFENILNNSKNKKCNIIDLIKHYEIEYNNMYMEHPLLKQFTDSMNLLYENKYKNKTLFDKLKNHIIEDINLSIKVIDKSLVIIPHSKNKSCIHIKNIDTFESVLDKYINTIKNSDSCYNIFNKSYYNVLTKEEQIRMIFQYTMLNISKKDLLDIEKYFERYNYYIEKNHFNKIKNPTYICDIEKDNLYVMSKCSEIEDETPYYLSFIFEKSKVELPKVMIGIDENNTAHILNIKPNKFTFNKINYNELTSVIQNLILSNSSLKYSKPMNIISFILTLGILNGMNINKIILENELLFKTNNNDLENSDINKINLSNNIYSKDIVEYINIISLIKGIDIIDDSKIELKINKNINCDNEKLLELYNAGIKVGKNICSK